MNTLNSQHLNRLAALKINSPRLYKTILLEFFHLNRKRFKLNQSIFVNEHLAVCAVLHAQTGQLQRRYHRVLFELICLAALRCAQFVWVRLLCQSRIGNVLFAFESCQVATVGQLVSVDAAKENAVVIRGRLATQ